MRGYSIQIYSFTAINGLILFFANKDISLHPQAEDTVQAHSSSLSISWEYMKSLSVACVWTNSIFFKVLTAAGETQHCFYSQK